MHTRSNEELITRNQIARSQRHETKKDHNLRQESSPTEKHPSDSRNERGHRSNHNTSFRYLSSMPSRIRFGVDKLPV